MTLFCGVFVSANCHSVTAKEPENPYPYGKAEFTGANMNDVVEILEIGDKYRRLCSNCVDKTDHSLIEHYGREAKNWYREAIDREPSNAYASLSLGYVDLLLGRAATNKNTQQDHFSTALSRFREALEKRPGYAQAYLYMAQVQALSEHYDDARKNLRLILDSGIEDSHIHAWMAYVLIKMEQNAQASKHISRAIELDNPSPAARWARQHQKNKR